MKQAQFESSQQAHWQALEQLLQSKDAQERLALPVLYRQLCQSLALARQRGYSPQLCERLHTLALRSHQVLYGVAAARPSTLLQWLGRDFPQRVREQWRLLLLLHLAFYGVALAIGLLIYWQPQWAYAFDNWQNLSEMREMYAPDKQKLGRGGSDSDLMMFGFYIWNNVSIGFRSFAGGLFGGVLALWSVLHNGIHLGVVGGWLSREPDVALTFWSFVITHSSFEISGLLLAALAGMRMGLDLLLPDARTRVHALQESARYVFPIITGASLMIVLAAFFEAFWSAAGSIPSTVKIAVGAACWILVFGFFGLAGRAHHATR